MRGFGVGWVTEKVVNVADLICLTADPSFRPRASLRACGGALHKQRLALRSLYGWIENICFGRVPSVAEQAPEWRASS